MRRHGSGEWSTYCAQVTGGQNWVPNIVHGDFNFGGCTIPDPVEISNLSSTDCKCKNWHSAAPDDKRACLDPKTCPTNYNILVQEAQPQQK